MTNIFLTDSERVFVVLKITYYTAVPAEDLLPQPTFRCIEFSTEGYET